MSLYLNRVWRRYPITQASLIRENAAKIKLQPVKQITARFDPFRGEVATLRSFVKSISGYKGRKTNPSVKFINEIRNDRSDPELCIDLLTGEKIVIKTVNLRVLELYELFNKHVSSLVPVEEEIPATARRQGKIRR